VARAWTPETDEHRRLLAEVVDAARNLNAASAALWAKFEEARAAGVSLSYAADQAGISRATLYRHLQKD
jgi:hypothetical protein